MATVLLVDDHPLMRQALALTLDAEPDFEVVAQVDSAEAALELLDGLTPDLAVVDVSLPTMNGIELTKHLLARQPDLKVLIVSRHDESLYAERALRAGAKGYVMKLEPAETIVRAVRKVLRGGLHVSDDVSERMLAAMAAGQPVARSPMEVLSDRELEVFEMIGRGEGTREISERLHLSVKTVESYRARIKAKLGLETAPELIQHAVRWVEGEGAG